MRAPPCRTFDVLSHGFGRTPHLRPAPQPPVAGLRRARRDHYDPRCHGDRCLHLRDLSGAEDFAVLGWWNAYDYYSHLRLKHLSKTDLSGLKLEFDIEYDQTLDGAMRFDAAKFPSVSWDAMTFVTGVGDTHDVRLLDYATVVSGSETAATVFIDISGDENMDGGIDWLHLYFRDTRFTVTSTDCRVETQLTADVNAGDASMPVQNTAGFSAADGIWIERAGTNEEQTTVAGVLSISLTATVSMDHPNGSFVTRNWRIRHGIRQTQ